jgi:hypothetical protein
MEQGTHSRGHSIISFSAEGTAAGAGLHFIPAEAAEMGAGPAKIGSKPKLAFERILLTEQCLAKGQKKTLMHLM